MKISIRYCRPLFVAALAVMVAIVCRGEFETVGGATWEYKERDGGVWIQSCTPTATYVSIPETLGGKKVKRLNCYVCFYDRLVKTVHIPAGVTAFIYGNNNSFAGSYVLANIECDENNPNFKSVDGILYNKALTEVVAVPATRTGVTLPQTLTTIGSQAFQGSKVTAVTLPETVTSIGNGAFSECTQLRNINIPSGLTYLGRGAFCWCGSLENIVLPEGIASIGGETFYCCNSLTNVTIAGKLIDVGYRAFGYCSSLEEIDLPKTVSYVGSESFMNCTGLRTVKYRSHFAPSAGLSIFSDAYDCTVYVPRESFGWEMAIPGQQYGVGIDYLDAAESDPCVDLSNINFVDWMTKKCGWSGNIAELQSALTAPAANPKYTLAEAYVAGLDPEDPNAEFRAILTNDCGNVILTWEPKLEKQEEDLRTYVLLGKTNLDDPYWSVMDDGSYASKFNFFKVFVMMK